MKEFFEGFDLKGDIDDSIFLQQENGRKDGKGAVIFKSEEIAQEAKEALDRWIKRYRRKYPCAPFLWVAEIQPTRYARSGVAVIHFHVVLKTWMDIDWVERSWRECTGQKTSRQDVRRIKGAEGLARYLSKYLTKETVKNCHIGANRYGMSRDVSNAIKKRVISSCVSTHSEWKRELKKCPNTDILSPFWAILRYEHLHDWANDARVVDHQE